MIGEPTVFVLGAGASYGDTLVSKLDCKETKSRIPLIDQSFRSDCMFDRIDNVERDYSSLIKYIKDVWRIDDSFGTGAWRSLDLEGVFTSLAIDTEFASDCTDEKAEAQLRLNALKMYIASSISARTLCRYGKFTRQLVKSLTPQDSIISFNYDLLVDAELLGGHNQDSQLHYERFSNKLLGQSLIGEATKYSPGLDQGLYLKLHGSLNWFLCNNTACRNSNKIKILQMPDEILGATKRRARPQCDVCERALSSYLVTPLLNKPIMRDHVSRIVWSNALSLLLNASKIVIIGYSFPATDFYSEWLFRTALWDRDLTKVWVVNPLNNPNCQETASRDAFAKRLGNVIGDYDSSFSMFDQIAEVLAALETD